MIDVVAEPFPYAVLDGYWPAEALRSVRSEFPAMTDIRWRRFDNPRESKLEGGPELWGPHTTALLRSIRARAALLSTAFDISGLTMETIGGGMHCIPPGGHLDTHIDFTQSPQTGWYRRLNYLVFLNEPPWDDPGGHLCLGDPPTVDILPEFNRTVVFATSDTSWHGHPIPAGRPRLSVAAYFYSPYPPPGFTEHDTVFL